MRRLSCALAITLSIAACGHTASPVGRVRFVNEPPVWHVNDRKDVPKPPKEIPFLRYTYHFDSYYLRTVKGLQLTRHRRALGVNSLDEVPNSTWFTNRIGVRNVTPDEIREGPGPDSPDRHLPWTIKSGKFGGTAIGFICEDSRGVKFLLKFDSKNIPETETATDAIVARILWAAGYNVPADHVVYFKRGDLKVAPDAYKKDQYDRKSKLDDKFVDDQLKEVQIGSDGQIRGIASIYIPGKPLGGMPRLGVRSDDVNDRIPHELRRDQRGQAPLFAWLSHTDVKEDNSLDAYQEDPKNKNLHYVVHYLLDFGNALGTDALVTKHPYVGFRYEIDPAATATTLLSFGLQREPWEFREPAPMKGVGMFSDKLYDPGTWKPNTMAQLPVIWADRFDQYWGSKILIRFTREQLAAAIDAGRLSEPRAKAYLLDTLINRQRRTARYWFKKVNPVDEFAIDGRKLCFTDLALRHQLETIPTRFTLSLYDANEVAVGTPMTIAPDPRGHACATVPLADGANHYTIVRIETSRGMPATLVHIATDAAGKARVIGIHRL
ncbi:MAG TPA: hypothetical protein VFQ53_28100 [Kofleriaceae bacterium]|nr:hypothetical protein [Kofleriaceae bacterium]